MLESRINQMFIDINEKITDMIEIYSSMNDACDLIAKIVGSETATRSKTMLSDLYTVLSKQVLDSVTDVPKQNRFYEANLRQEIFEKYSFAIPSERIDLKEADRIFISMAVGAGTAVVGALLVYALSPAAPTLPIAIVVAAAVSAFCVSYFKVTPNITKSNFKDAVNKYLMDVKESYIAWFEEVEHYFNKRVEEILRSL
jgi:hypothetical protein